MLVEKHSPHIVSIMIGGNDSVYLEDMPLVSLGEYERNVRSMVKWAKDSGAKVMLFEVTPVDEKAFKKNFSEQHKTQTNKNIDRYNTILREIARDNGTKVLYDCGGLFLVSAVCAGYVLLFGPG